MPDGARGISEATVSAGRPEDMTGAAGLAEKGTAAAGLRFLGLLLERWHWMLWVLSWSVFSLVILFLMSSQAAERRQEALTSMCDERARMLQDQVNATMNSLQALAILISTFHHSKNPSAMDQTTFARFAERTKFERPLTSGVAYAARVMHAERELFERQQAWPIKKLYSPGAGDAAGDYSEVRELAEEYAPVIFAEDAYKHVISLDMLSGVEDRENVQRARESGKPALTAPFKMLNDRIGVILTHTVSKSELPRNATPQLRIQSAIGYLGCILDIEKHVDKILHQLASKQSIMVTHDTTTNDSPISMYGSNSNDTGVNFAAKRIASIGDGYKEMSSVLEKRADQDEDADVLDLFLGESLEKGADEGELEPEVDQIVEKLEEELNLHPKKMLVQEKLRETEAKMEELGKRSKFIAQVKKLGSAIIHSFPSRFRYLTKTIVMSVGLVGLVVYIFVTGTFDPPPYMMSNNFDWSRGRLLIARLNGSQWPKGGGAQNSDMATVDLRKLRGNNDTSGQLKHWSSRNSSEIIPTPAHKSHKITVGPWIALVAVIMLVLGIAVWLLLRCNSRKRAPQSELELLGAMGPRRFQLHELVAATSKFTEENKLGQGGFGPVYKGYLSDQDRHVAIKVLSKKQSSQEQSEQGLREFMAEVRVMTQLRHRNIVKLVGWCDSNKRLLLVYELMAQGSLDKHLYDPERILTWQQRCKIAIDLGSALLYLHRECEKCIVHGDIKPANVMLDVSHNARLGDFGLARLVENGDEPQTTQVVAGTAGYIDPEFINNRWPRTELDVYSFGVVLLEIASGKRPTWMQPNGASTLLAWVLHLYDRGLILDAADPRLNGEFDQQQMERVLVTGLWCARQDPMLRPSIVEAMDVLRYADAELPVIPAVRDARRIRSMEEQVYGELPVTDHPVHGVAPSTYFTSKDSGYLLAEE
ncbi:hypothetical protein U9M48_024973 [Paspalum notatum var. saurae]|uniref:Protein kinase domain-containing protein n=1 Tax=Paspalum notatum var. saurae TaxID=547442 RepID=A0AAQ3TPM0_PASNO